MHIEMLEHFQQIADAKSISKVASEAHLSQSALSQMIQKMEEAFGYKLLARSNKGVEPTEMGKIVLKYASTIIKSYEKMQIEMRELEKQTQTIRILSDKNLVNYALPSALYKIKHRFPNNKYELFTRTTDEIVEEVRADRCDMGVTSEQPVAEDLEVSKIGREKVVLVTSGASEIPSTLTVEELLKYELIALSGTHYVTSSLKHELKKKGLSENSLSILFEVDAISAVKSSILNNYGISFLPLSAVKYELAKAEFKQILLRGVELYHEIYVVHKPFEQISGPSRQTIESFIEMGEASFR
jgi:DNA-binding transcriptional LysR family regulator